MVAVRGQHLGRRMLDRIVDALIVGAEAGRVLWPDLGVFSMQVHRNMPGLPGHRRLMFRPASYLFCVVNETADSPIEDDGATDWCDDDATLKRTADIIGSELVRAGEVAVPALGTFGVQKRKTSTVTDQYWVEFRAAPEVIRKLNPKDRNYEASLKVDWPDGITEPDAGEAH